MTQTKKMSYKTGNYPLFSLKMRQFGRKLARNRVKTPPAVAIHGENFCPKKFTGKERDMETGLYYYGARYLDSRTSRWISGDPAVGEYVPEAPVNDEARKRNGNLPGQGGVFNYVNLHVYHYAGNNPVKYIDPNGRNSKLPLMKMSMSPRIEVKRGIDTNPGQNNFNDTFRIYDTNGNVVFTAMVHAEMSMTATASNDFTLPAGEYTATLSNTASKYDKSLSLSSKSVISPETGRQGISILTGHLVHPNEITNEKERTRRTMRGDPNGPFNTPQSLGCILFKNKEEFNKMWNTLVNMGYDIGDSIRFIIKDPVE